MMGPCEECGTDVGGTDSVRGCDGVYLCDDCHDDPGCWVCNGVECERTAGDE